MQPDRIEQIVGVLGFPRSGTTMFTAVLDTHDKVVAVYEPWNAQKHLPAHHRQAISVASLITHAGRDKRTARTLVVKETTADHTYPVRLLEVLTEAWPPLSTFLFLIVRNPFHCFLSEVEGRRRWWGDADLEVNEETFGKWSDRTLGSLTQMLHLSSSIPNAFVFYEACVSKRVETFRAVMQAVGLEFSENQLRIAANANLSKVRGDISLIESARDVGDMSVIKRKHEFAAIHGKFLRSKAFERIARIANVLEHFQHYGLLRLGEPAHSEFVAAMRETEM